MRPIPALPFWSIVGVFLLIGVHFLWRLYLLRPSATRVFRAVAQAPLRDDERAKLKAWAKRGRRLFVEYWIVFAVVFAASALAVTWRMTPPRVMYAVVWLAVLGVVAGLSHTLSEKCPRCGYRLGLESGGGFRVPSVCPRCRVVCNSDSPIAALARALGQTNGGDVPKQR